MEREKIHLEEKQVMPIQRYKPEQIGVPDSSRKLIGIVICGIFLLAVPGSIMAANNETFLYAFNGTPDGLDPYSGLTRDQKGNLGAHPFRLNPSASK